MSCCEDAEARRIYHSISLDPGPDSGYWKDLAAFQSGGVTKIEIRHPVDPTSYPITFMDNLFIIPRFGKALFYWSDPDENQHLSVHDLEHVHIKPI